MSPENRSIESGVGWFGKTIAVWCVVIVSISVLQSVGCLPEPVDRDLEIILHGTEEEKSELYNR